MYTLDFFKARREKLLTSLSEIEEKKAFIERSVMQLESQEASQSSLIPNTEALLASYGDMTVPERNQLLKAILRRIEYQKGPDGKIVIDLYPQLPRFEPQDQAVPLVSSE